MVVHPGGHAGVRGAGQRGPQGGDVSVEVGAAQHAQRVGAHLVGEGGEVDTGVVASPGGRLSYRVRVPGDTAGRLDWWGVAPVEVEDTLLRPAGVGFVLVEDGDRGRGDDGAGHRFRCLGGGVACGGAGGVGPCFADRVEVGGSGADDVVVEVVGDGTQFEDVEFGDEAAGVGGDPVEVALRTVGEVAAPVCVGAGVGGEEAGVGGVEVGGAGGVSEVEQLQVAREVGGFEDLTGPDPLVVRVEIGGGGVVEVGAGSVGGARGGVDSSRGCAAWVSAASQSAWVSAAAIT